MSTILTINTNKPKTRVEFSQPLQSISEIQLLDYDFPETLTTFKTNQIVINSQNGNKLIIIPAGTYSSSTIRSYFTTNQYFSIIPWNGTYSISCKDCNTVPSTELKNVLGLTAFLYKGMNYPVSWPSHKIHIYCDIGTSNSVLGQITTVGNKLVPTNLLAVVPSKSGFYPSCSIQAESGPINSITLSVMYENGNNPSWFGESFRLNLRVTY